MQILFAAPFLLAAALAFTILAAFPRGRRWAIPIPTGILASAPCFFAVFGGELLAAHWLGHDLGPGRKALLVYLSIAILAGILGGVAAGIVARLLTGILSRLLLRAALIAAAACSYFVLFILLDIAASSWWRLSDNAAVWIAGLVLSFTGAWLTTRNPEPFRSSRFRLPVGSRFRYRMAGTHPSADSFDKAPKD